VVADTLVGGRPPVPSVADPLMADLIRTCGRLGQFAGLTLPALAIVLELQHAISLGQMLVMLLASVCCFWIGRLLEAYAAS
jgi:hypothetical protein